MPRCGRSRNSFLLAFTTALVSAAVAVPLAYLATLRQNRIARVLDAVADAPYAVPGHRARDRDHPGVPAAVAAPRCQSLRHDRHHPRGLSGALSALWRCGRPWPAWSWSTGISTRRRRSPAPGVLLRLRAVILPVGRAVGGGRRAADLHDRVQRAHGLGAAVVDRPRDARRGGVLSALRGQLAGCSGGRDDLGRGDARACHACERCSAASCRREWCRGERELGRRVEAVRRDARRREYRQPQRSRTASSSRCSDRPAAARPRCCGWSRASRRPMPAR